MVVCEGRGEKGEEGDEEEEEEGGGGEGSGDGDRRDRAAHAVAPPRHRREDEAAEEKEVGATQIDPQPLLLHWANHDSSINLILLEEKETEKKQLIFPLVFFFFLVIFWDLSRFLYFWLLLRDSVGFLVLFFCWFAKRERDLINNWVMGR